MAIFLVAATPVRAASIAGTVIDASTHAGIEGIEACAYEAAFENESEAQPGKKCSPSESGGEYVINGVAAGFYKVAFWPPVGSKYLPQFYKGRQSWQEAATVEVLPNSQTADVDASLKEATSESEDPAAGEGSSTSGPPPSGDPVVPTAPPAAAPKPKPLHCRKGFKKMKRRGKLRCVRTHRPAKRR